MSSSCEYSLRSRRGGKTRSSQQSETAEDQPTTEAESASRYNLKRKHEVNSSVQPQYQVLHYQLPQNTIEGKVAVQHGTLAMLDTVKNEPSDTTVVAKEELMDVTNVCKSLVKQECKGSESEMVLFDNPDPETLMSDVIPESSVNPELPSKLNEDIRHIFKRTTNEKNSEENLTKENVMSLTSQNVIMNFVEIKCEPSLSSSQSKDIAPKQENSTHQELKNSFFIRCEQCKQFLFDETSAKSHKCPVSTIQVTRPGNIEPSLKSQECPEVSFNQNAMFHQSISNTVPQPIVLFPAPHSQDFANRKIVPKPNSIRTSEQPSQQLIQLNPPQSNPISQRLFQQQQFLPSQPSVVQKIVSQQPLLIATPSVSPTMVSQPQKPFLIPTPAFVSPKMVSQPQQTFLIPSPSVSQTMVSKPQQQFLMSAPTVSQTMVSQPQQPFLMPAPTVSQTMVSQPQQPFLMPAPSVSQTMVSQPQQPFFIPAPFVSQTMVSQPQQPFLIQTPAFMAPNMVSKQPFFISLPSAVNLEPQIGCINIFSQPINQQSNFIKIAPKPENVKGSEKKNESLDPISLQIDLRNQPRTFAKLVPNDCDSFPSAAHEKLYRHFCKYHFKFNEHQIMSSTVTVPHLLKTLPPSTNSLNLYKCKQCSMMYKSTGELKLHLFTVHRKSDADIVQCKVCDFHLEFRLETFLDHVRKHKDHYNHFVEPGVVWRCLECEILSEQCIAVDATVTLLHLKNVIIIRKHTSVNFKLRNSVYFNYKIDSLLPAYPHTRQLYSCICLETFETQYQLNQHLESHVDCAFRRCSGCQLGCDNMNLYYLHLENTHISSLMQDMDLRNRKEQPSFKNKQFVCNLKACSSAKFMNGCSLQLHVLQRHKSMVSVGQISDLEKLQCPFCNVVFFDPKMFYAHCVPYTPLLPNLKQGEVFVCRICNMAQPENLERHVAEEHNVPKIYCILCKCNIVCKEEAFLHLRSCYSVEPAGQNFICPICGFICDDLEFLINHIRVDLDTLKPRHQCKFCLNLFYAKFNLSWHLCDTKCIQLYL